MRPYTSTSPACAARRRLATLAAWLCGALVLSVAGAQAQTFDTLVRANTNSSTRNGQTYTVCVKPRQLNDQACVWSLEVEEDAPGALTTRPWAIQASDDGLRLAVLLRKRSGSNEWDELWRFEQSLNPRFAAHGVARDEQLQTRSRKLASGPDLQFGGNDTLTRFAIWNGSQLRFVSSDGRDLVPAVGADAFDATASSSAGAVAGPATLQLVARQGARIGFVQWLASNAAEPALARRLVVADLDARAIDAFDLRGLVLGEQQQAWNLSHNWVALGDQVFPSDPRKPRELRLRVMDLANARLLWSTSNQAAFDPVWRNPELLEYALPNKRLTTHRLEGFNERLFQGQLRLQGSRLIFLPCRERSVMQVEYEGSDAATVDALRDALSAREKLAAEFTGSADGATVRLTHLVQTASAGDFCKAPPDRALLEASGRDPSWKLAVARGAARLELDGQAASSWPAASARFVEGVRFVELASESARVIVRATPELCRATAGDVITGYRVQFQIGSRNYSGCGNLIDTGR